MARELPAPGPPQCSLERDVVGFGWAYPLDPVDSSPHGEGIAAEAQGGPLGFSLGPTAKVLAASL